MRRLLQFLALMALPTLAAAETPEDVVRKYGLAGEILIGRGEKIVLHQAYGTVSPSGGRMHRIDERWRMASVTKQIAAALLLRETDLAYLDKPLAAGWPTPRQMLTHHKGLANPDDTPPDAAGVPSFYSSPKSDPSYCKSKKAQPGAAFKYNNCDYLLLRSATYSWRWSSGLTMARRGAVGVPGFVKGKAEPHFRLARWGAAGGLIGTARSLFNFDRALMTGRLLSSVKRAELWKPEGQGSYQALGQWVFPGNLKGCSRPKRSVQRDGEIFGVQVRNFIFPDDDLVVIIFTNRSADDFAIGEVWQQSGFAYDLLSAAACA